jgi:trehalose/maltose hydrolase-like predicted phosphorylase
MKKTQLNNKSLYPFEEWSISQDHFDVDSNYIGETIFALGNGYIGMRGTFEEGYTGPKGSSLEGTYINGFYDTYTISYGEVAYGYAEKGQTMLNVTNGKVIRIYIDDEPFDMLRGELVGYKRTLDLKKGILIRDITWRSPKGREVKIVFKRLVSFTHKQLAAIHLDIIPINFDGKITLITALDASVSNLTVENDPRIGSGLKGKSLIAYDRKIHSGYGYIASSTQNTDFKLICGMKNSLEYTNSYSMDEELQDEWVSSIYNIDAFKGQVISLNKYIAYITSLDFEEEDMLSHLDDILEKGENLGFERLCAEQEEYLDKFWYRSNISIDGDMSLQQGLRFNMFHLLQSTGRDGKTNIASKGLTGEGYEGHYFWDTETYILPFFIYNHPDISRQLLVYRYGILDKARERARQMGHKKGALFPWRTIGGEECSPYYPAGTAQYHINADIALAIKKYMDATGDVDFLISYGAEMLFETAILWADLGDFIPEKGNQFCINGVTGPDEYTAIVNNNVYTNMMARENLWYAHEVALWLKKNAEDVYRNLCTKLDIDEKEIGDWKIKGDRMYIPKDKKTGLYPQDDSFFQKAVWNFEQTPKENYPLLLHYHPLVIYRHQVCKQADLVLAMYLLGQYFTQQEKEVNYDYYERITTHDSSLSTCVFSIMANEIGYREKAYKYFMDTARMDLDDYQGNTKDGIHAANMAGTWMCVVNGFAGMRTMDGAIYFNPYIPEGWSGYSFRINYHGTLIEVNINRDEVAYKLLDGERAVIYHKSEKLLLDKGHPSYIYKY